MAYARVNYQTKKALKEAVAAGTAGGVFQPGPFGGTPPTDGEVTLEGPHYPEPHRWYAVATVRGGEIVAVK